MQEAADAALVLTRAALKTGIMYRHFSGMKQDILRDLNLRVSALLSNRK